MGGLVSMDAALQLHRTTPKGREVWPCVAGILAYDTPYLGGTCPAHAVHPHVFKHQFSTYHEYANSAIKLGAILGPIGGSLAAQFTSRPSPRANAPASSSRLSTAAWVGVGTAAVAAVGTAAATAILNRVDPANEPYRWIMDHLAFVRNLWETDAMSQRLEDGIRHEIPFHCFYTRLTNRPGSIGAPAAGPLDPTVRTFILVPGADKVYARHFSPLDSVGVRGSPTERHGRDPSAHLHVPGGHQYRLLPHGPRLGAARVRVARHACAPRDGHEPHQAGPRLTSTSPSPSCTP